MTIGDIHFLVGILMYGVIGDMHLYFDDMRIVDFIINMYSGVKIVASLTQ